MFRRLTTAVLLVIGFAANLSLGKAADAAAAPDTSDQFAIREAASWIRRENKIETEYRYVMTCKVRFVFFWGGRDDVGGGYVHIGKAAGDERQQMVQILFGSDPAKAPLSINRWGAGTEVLRSQESGQPFSSAFFGFMKSSKGQSMLAMRSELSKEKSNGTHLFEGIISRVDQDRALTTSVPYKSNQDFDFHQYGDAEKAALHELENDPARHIGRVDGATGQPCPRVGEFLTTVLQLMSDAMAGHSTPESLCYIYNARHYTATLTGVQPVAAKNVHVQFHANGGSLDRAYRNLKDAHFEVACRETGTKSAFNIILGTEGNLRGTPIQINYQPNWWFQVVLNLVPNLPSPNGPGISH
jgi:hypothetical protein